MYEAIETLNSYGLEVTSGIILGLDTDTDDTERRLIDFIDRSQHPGADHQSAAGAAEDAALGPAHPRGAARRTMRRSRSNVAVHAPARRRGGELAPGDRPRLRRPSKLFERFRHQVETTYPSTA